MDKNNDIFINYYVNWKSSDWMKDLFDQINVLEFDEVTELYNLLGEPNKQVTPERAPSLNDNQRGI